MNHRSWVTAMTVPLVIQRAFERVGGGDVEIVGRLVQQQHRRRVELHQQDLDRACCPPDRSSNGLPPARSSS
jgi:hypothetical protein